MLINPNFSFIPSGRSKGFSVVTDIRALQYNPKWRGYASIFSLVRVAVKEEKIERNKFEDLPILKQSLESDYNSFDDNIPIIRSNTLSLM